ncbi:MAG: hypothetical protein ABL974_08885 [Prosthecobacter sp.]
MINPSSVIFIIQAGIKLAQKAEQVLIDETLECAAVLPVGEDAGSQIEADALRHYRKHPELRAPGEVYADAKTDADIAKAYVPFMGIENSRTKLVTEALKQLPGIDQVKDGFGANPALQRILGTVVEIGIDYFAANPDKLGKNTGTRQVLESFIRELEEVSFSETTPKALIQHVMHASLRTLNDHVSLIDDDQRLQVLLGGVTQSLLEDYDALTKPEARVRRGALIKRISSSVVRGGASALTGNIDLFMRGDVQSKTLIKATLSSVVAGIDGKEDLFTNESLEMIYHSALTAVAENSTVFTDNKLLSSMIGSVVSSLTTPQADKVFGKETVAAIVQSALEAVTENFEMLIDPDSPEKQLLADTVTAIANGLGKRLAGDATAKNLLSKRQLIELTGMAFAEVAKHPEQLMHGVADDELKTVLAQIIGSTAKALGDDPQKLVTGEGFLTLVQAAIKTGVLNADKLLDINTTSVRNNVLFQITQQAANAVLESQDPRRLMSRDVFVATVTGILPVVSANLDGLLGKRIKEPIKTTISTVLALAASGDLENRINGANLPALIEEMLIQVLQNELTLTDNSAVISTAGLILQHI